MSVRHRHAARGQLLARSAVPILVLTMLAILAGEPLSSGSRFRVELLTTRQAQAAGAAIPITAHPESGGTILEVALAPARRVVAVSAREQARRDALRLLAVGSAGSAAIRDAVDDPGSALTIAHSDESQTRVALPGVAAAAFAPGEAWLAAIDASGGLWNVDPVAGQASRLADGPYLGSLAFTRGGSLLLIEVSSVEAPYFSQLVRFNPATRSSTPLMTEPGFVFSARELDDGSVAVVRHPFGGGVAVRHIGASGEGIGEQSLDARAVDVSLSDDGATIAYAVVDVGIYVVAAGAARQLSDGDLPRVAPDGRSVLVLRGGHSVLLTLDGQEVGRIPSGTAAWAVCAGGCRS